MKKQKAAASSRSSCSPVSEWGGQRVDAHMQAHPTPFVANIKRADPFHPNDLRQIRAMRGCSDLTPFKAACDVARTYGRAAD